MANQVAVSSSPATELKVTKQVVNKLGETLENFKVHAVSILSLSEKWQTMESSFAMAEASMATQEKNLEWKKREISKIERKVENLLSDMKGRQEKLNSGERRLKERVRAVERREKKVKECRQVAELEEGEINDRRTTARGGGGGGGRRTVAVCDSCRVLKEEREKEVVARRKSEEWREKEMKERENLLELWEKEIDQKSSVLEEREKEIEDRRRELEEREKEIDDRRKAEELRKKEIDEFHKEAELREAEIRRRGEELDLREKKLIEDYKARFKGFESNDLFKTRGICKEMEKTQKEIIEKLKVLEANRREFGDCLGVDELVEMETDEGFEVGMNEGRQGVEVEVEKLFENLDAKGVMMYLIEHENVDDLWQEKLLDYLRLASDPAMLVLEVVRGFRDLGLCNIVASGSETGCINLLAQLMRLEPEMSVCVRTEAENFAADWRSSVVKQDSGPFEIYCFLQFIASFKLYDADELLLLFQAFCDESELFWPDQYRNSCYGIGLSEKILALIQSLILKEKHLQALLYICAFKLEDAFSAQSLLDAHLEHIRKRAQEIVKEASNKAQDDAAKMELTALRTMLKCISYAKLESRYGTAPLQLRITQLEKEIEGRKVMPKLVSVKIEKDWTRT